MYYRLPYKQRLSRMGSKNVGQVFLALLILLSIHGNRCVKYVLHNSNDLRPFRVVNYEHSNWKDWVDAHHS